MEVYDIKVSCKTCREETTVPIGGQCIKKWSCPCGETNIRINTDNKKITISKHGTGK